jgi:hypothetical protein
VLVQITRRTPLRRTILQFSQIRLTLLRTFMGVTSPSGGNAGPKSGIGPYIVYTP